MEPFGVRKVELETVKENTGRPGFKTPTDGKALSRPQVTNDNQSIRRIERDTEPTTRPRDAALRAMNDNRRFEIVRQNRPAANPAYPTIDQQFAESYNEQGVGPTLMAEGGSNPSSSGNYRARVQQKNSRRPSGSTIKPESSVSGPQGARRKSFNPRKSLKKKLMGKQADGTLGNLVDRAVATEATLSILAWGSWVWIGLQLPLAILAVIFFNLAIAWESIKESSGIIGDIVSTVASGLSSVVNYFTGIDFAAFNPENFFLITNSAAMFVGWATMLAMGLTYAVLGLPALSGKGVTLKYLTFILGLFGYFVPVLNLFPWAVFWAIAVWCYPTDVD